MNKAITLVLAQATQSLLAQGASAEIIVLEVDRQTITLDFHKTKVGEVKDVTDCVYISWRKGGISHRQAIQALSRLACVDNDRLKGRPPSFHGDSWVSTGHWSKVINDVIYIYTKGTKEPLDSGRIKLLFLQHGLATRIVTKSGERIEFEKKPLSNNQKAQLIACVQQLEELIAQDDRFSEKEPFDASLKSGDCESTVVVNTLKPAQRPNP
ncbi:hypothetical protein [Geothrix sp.]|jgi:hypothetical protein|uniref:hypothetical protein n=1 Tax=Geothrix sp. TaxID=1962974 RepID=UPI0025BBCB7E|nr:hypothetical protein [Geothrix sp.]